MSGSISTPAKAPKTMSSKLLTMKFMQRAAASSPVSNPSAPDHNSPGPRESGKSPPTEFDADSLADQRAIQAALAAEETKRQMALERQAADAGDTRWVLNFSQDMQNSDSQAKATLRVIQTGFAAIDDTLPGDVSSVQDCELISDRLKMVGRRSFGKFNSMSEKTESQNPEASSDSSSDDDNQSVDESMGSDSDDPTGTNALLKAAREEATYKLKAERKAKKKADKAESLRLAEKRKKKDVKLNRLTSISGNGGDNKTCYRCGQEGHFERNCPQKGRRDRDNEQDQPKKKIKKSK